MVRDRSKRAIIATVNLVLWMVFMGVGLAFINSLAPTVGGEGPEGTAAFIGLVWGVVAVGLIMWAASD
ncbi:MAG TPA: hypothetical protein VEW95_05265 [Candidatus Limnocylindrales bacterium]|nr:hypothetical protein [Candidatus Limnocylindrales bacterium]